MQAGSVLDRMADAPGERVVDCQPTEPIRVEGDHDGSETLVRWLGIHELYYLALGDQLQRFSEVVGSDQLALRVFRRVKQIEGEDPNHRGLTRPKDPAKIAAGFDKLARLMRCDLFQIGE